MKIKPFIYNTTLSIEGIPVLKSIKNKYGVEIKFYIIDNANLNIFKKEVFEREFKNTPTDDNLRWLLNRWAVAIVSNTYLLNKWLNKELYLSLDPENWTRVDVVLD